MSEPLDSLPPDIQAILASERRSPQVTPRLRNQLRARLQAELPSAWPIGPGPNASRLGAPLARWLLPLFFLGGVATGMALQTLRSSPSAAAPLAPEPAPERTPPPLSPAPPPVQSGPQPPAAIPTRPARRTKPPPTSPPEPVTRTDADLTAETALLERVRSALARQQSGEALAAIEEHLHRFPSGRLSEEREALRVQALVQSGRAGDARAQAAHFRALYPDSLLQPAVDAAVQSIP